MYDGLHLWTQLDFDTDCKTCSKYALCNSSSKPNVKEVIVLEVMNWGWRNGEGGKELVTQV